MIDCFSALVLLEADAQVAWLTAVIAFGPLVITVSAITLLIVFTVKKRRKEKVDGDRHNGPKNQEAKKLYRRALNGNAQSWYNMYLFAYEHSRDADVDFKYRRWHDFLGKAAEKGHPQAMCKYGDGLLSVDRERGMRFLEKSAVAGVDEACLKIAQEYANGLYGYFPEGVKQTSEEECAKNAANWLKVAADRGSAQAMAKLGDITWFNLHDEDGALEWFLKAAELGYDEGQLGAGRIYDKRKEFYKAKKYYCLAAEQGNTYAQLDLAEMLLLPEIFYDKDKALYWCEKSANGGNTLAMLKLAELYRDGNIVEKDIEKCVFWLEKAAKEGDDNAAYEIGKRYLSGDGVEKNEKKAIKYLKFSAGKYNDDAMCELGFCYLNAVGVEKNLPKAEKMFKRAVNECDNARAKEALETYFKKQ